MFSKKKYRLFKLKNALLKILRNEKFIKIKFKEIIHTILN